MKLGLSNPFFHLKLHSYKSLKFYVNQSTLDSSSKVCNANKSILKKESIEDVSMQKILPISIGSHSGRMHEEQNPKTTKASRNYLKKGCNTTVTKASGCSQSDSGFLILESNKELCFTDRNSLGESFKDQTLVDDRPKSTSNKDSMIIKNKHKDNKTICKSIFNLHRKLTNDIDEKSKMTLAHKESNNCIKHVKEYNELMKKFNKLSNDMQKNYNKINCAKKSFCNFYFYYS